MVRLGRLVAGAAAAATPFRTAVAREPRSFSGCRFPGMDWTVHSSGRSGTFLSTDAHVGGDYLFVAGTARSIDPDDAELPEGDFNYALTGPFTRADPAGLSGETLRASLNYRTNLAIQVIEKTTGRPLEIATFPTFTASRSYGAGAAEVTTASGLKSRFSLGGNFQGSMAMPETASCTPFQNEIVSVSCSVNGEGLGSTTLEVMLQNEEKAPKSSFLAVMDTNNENGANWEGMTAQWVTVPWQGRHFARVHHTVVYPASGDILASGESCDGPAADCTGWVGKFAALDGSVIWDKAFAGYQYLWNLELDEEHGIIFFSGYHGEAGQKVTGCLQEADGDVVWLRTFNDTGLANRFTGEVKLAKDADGPYIYVAHFISPDLQSTSLDQGTPYAACLDPQSGAKIPAYEIVSDKFLEEGDCATRGYSFVPFDSEEAIAPAEASTGAECGTFGAYYRFVSCVIKYHKFTGRPQWSSTTVSSRGMETTDEGPLVVGPYHPTLLGSFSGVTLPNTKFNMQMYQGLLDKDTGIGTYMQSFFDNQNNIIPTGVAQDNDGDLYIVAYSAADKMVSATEAFTIDFPTTVDKTKDIDHHHSLVTKLLAGPRHSPVVPSCVICDDQGVTTGVKEGSCYIDQICYDDRSSALYVLNDPSLVCEASVSQTKFSDGLGGDAVESGSGTTFCDVCGEDKVMMDKEGIFDAGLFGFGEVQCGMLEEMGQTGTLPAVPGMTCETFSRFVEDPCSCAVVEEEEPSEPKPAQEDDKSGSIGNAEEGNSTPVVVELMGEGGAIEAGKGGLSIGAIIGIVVGSLVAIAAVAFLASQKKAAADKFNVEFDSNNPNIRAAIDAEKEIQDDEDPKQIGA